MKSVNLEMLHVQLFVILTSACVLLEYFSPDKYSHPSLPTIALLSLSYFIKLHVCMCVY